MFSLTDTFYILPSLVDDVNGALTRADVDVTGAVGEHGIRAKSTRVVSNVRLVRMNPTRHTLGHLTDVLRLTEVMPGSA